MQNTDVLTKLLNDIHLIIEEEFSIIKQQFLSELSYCLEQNIEKMDLQTVDFSHLRDVIRTEVVKTFDEDTKKSFSDLIDLVRGFKWGSLMENNIQREVEVQMFNDDSDISSITDKLNQDHSHNVDDSSPVQSMKTLKMHKNIDDSVEGSLRKDGYITMQSVNFRPSQEESIKSLPVYLMDNFELDKSGLADDMVEFLKRLLPKTVVKGIKGAFELNPTQDDDICQQAQSVRIATCAMGEFFYKSDFESTDTMVKIVSIFFNPKKVIKLSGVSMITLNKSRAIEEYISSTGNIVEDTGLWTRTECPWFGSSPDGLIYDVSTSEKGVLKVICPIESHGRTIDQYAQMNNSTLTTLNNDVSISKKSSHYIDMQASMFLLDAKWCDFVVWTGADLLIERVDRNQDMISQVIPTMTELYMRFILPTLAQEIDVKTVKSYRFVSKYAYERQFKEILSKIN